MNPLDTLKNKLNELQKERGNTLSQMLNRGPKSKIHDFKDIVDGLFPYEQHGPDDPPSWQRAKIIFMPRRPYLEGRIIWIRVGEDVKTPSYDVQTGEYLGMNESFITNLNGPNEEEDVIALFRNQIERMSGPEDFMWEEVEKIKFSSWEEGVVELTEEQEDKIEEDMTALREYIDESRRVYAEYMVKKGKEINLGLMATSGRLLTKSI
jgi:hypothetical protein